jgi:O-antigen ligase
MAKIFAQRWRVSPYRLALVLVVAAFLLGGGARGDILSLIILRPLAVLITAAALWKVSLSDLRSNLFLTTMIIAVVLLALLHLVPLPPAIWEGLPGRRLIADIASAAGSAATWRPLAMAPEQARNALFALFVPVGLYVLLVQLSSREVVRLGLVFISLGMLSALIGLLQAAGLGIHFYSIDTENAGLFSNHNHQATVLAALLPLTAFFASERSPLAPMPRPRRTLLAAVAALFIVPAILVAGSRAGLAVVLLALLSCPFVYAWGRVDPGGITKNRTARWVFAGAFVFAAAAIAWLFARSGQDAALHRLLASDTAEEARWPTWRTTFDLVQQYFPWGSGNGSFVEVFKIGERSDQLRQAYMNHAHNDWLEILLTAGVPGALILLAAVAASLLTFYKLARDQVAAQWRALASAGVIMVSLLGLASVVDYPIRVPSVSCLFIYAAYLAQYAWHPVRRAEEAKVV